MISRAAGTLPRPGLSSMSNQLEGQQELTERSQFALDLIEGIHIR